MVPSQPRWPQQSRSRPIDGLVDALVTQPHLRLLGELQPQVTADLLWAPPLAQKLRNHLPQFAVGLDASPMIAAPTAVARRWHRTDDIHDSWSRCGAARARPSKAPDPAGTQSAGCSSPRDADRR